MTEIRIRRDRKGNDRATYFCGRSMRWFAMPLDKARVMIATGKAAEAKSAQEIIHGAHDRRDWRS